MRTISGFPRRTFLLTTVGVLLSVALPVVRSADSELVPGYITTKELSAMASRTATFTKRLSEYSGSFAFTTADGERKTFVLGDARGEQSVWHFVYSLKEGQTYKLPDTFTSYLKAPNFETAREIAAMEPCTAIVASRSPCSSCLTTDDGRWISIGSPSSGKEVTHFIGTMRPFPVAGLCGEGWASSLSRK